METTLSPVDLSLEGRKEEGTRDFEVISDETFAPSQTSLVEPWTWEEEEEEEELKEKEVVLPASYEESSEGYGELEVEASKEEREESQDTEITLAMLLGDVSERSDAYADSGDSLLPNKNDAKEEIKASEEVEIPVWENMSKIEEKEEELRSAFEDEYVTADNGNLFTTEDDSVLCESDTDGNQPLGVRSTPLVSPPSQSSRGITPIAESSVQYSPIQSLPRRRKATRAEATDCEDRTEKSMGDGSKADDDLQKDEWLAKVRKSIALELSKSSEFRRSVTEELSKRVLDLEIAAKEALEYSSQQSEDETDVRQSFQADQSQDLISLLEPSVITESAEMEAKSIPPAGMEASSASDATATEQQSLLRENMEPAEDERYSDDADDVSCSSISRTPAFKKAGSRKEKLVCLARNFVSKGMSLARFCKENFAEMGMALVMGSALGSMLAEQPATSDFSRSSVTTGRRRLRQANRARGWPTGIWIVGEGDTLWSMSQKLLGDGERWPELYKACSRTLELDPRSLRPGTDLSPCRAELLARGSERQYSLQEQNVIITTKTHTGDSIRKIQEEIVGKGGEWAAAPLPMDTQEVHDSIDPGHSMKILLHHR